MCRGWRIGILRQAPGSGPVAEHGQQRLTPGAPHVAVAQRAGQGRDGRHQVHHIGVHGGSAIQRVEHGLLDRDRQRLLGADPVFEPILDYVGGVLDHDIDVGTLAFGEGFENVVGRVLGAGRPAHAELETGELLRAQGALQRADSIVAPTASSHLQPETTEREVDAFLGFPPEPQELRARKVGRVILNTTTDPPWSQYFCCMLAGNAVFIRDHPIATKRVLRAILKVADLCVAEPERVAQRLVDGGFTEHYDYALRTLTEVPYDRWREYDPADTLRFYALRLHEAGMITSIPQQIIAEGTDWRFLNELKRELKA